MPAQVDAAVNAARQAFAGWAKRSFDARLTVLEAFADSLANAPDAGALHR